MIQESSKGTQSSEESMSFNRSWDPALKSQTVKILAGQYYVTQKDEVLIAILGSCISACIRDVVIGLGGMNHFMLPEEQGIPAAELHYSPWNTAARYGECAMTLLLEEIFKSGGKRESLEIKLFGGTKVLAHLNDVGSLNIDFVRKFLRKRKLPIAAEDMGGSYPRKVIYSPRTGKVKVKRLPPIMNIEQSDMNKFELFKDG
jgi:chemotaxis protein CheD